MSGDLLFSQLFAFPDEFGTAVRFAVNRYVESPCRFQLAIDVRAAGIHVYLRENDLRALAALLLSAADDVAVKRVGVSAGAAIGAGA